jgi:type I restriction enzyme R subunit
MDFKQATSLFADPDFDGDPVQIYSPEEGDSVVPPDVMINGDDFGEDEAPYGGVTLPRIDTGNTGGTPTKYYVDDVMVKVAVERVQYLGADGKLITESLTDYTRKAVLTNYSSLDSFLAAWNSAERKQAIIDELSQQGVFLDELAAQVGSHYDAFDLICHVVFDQPPLTRKERAENVKKRNVFAKYGEQASAVLDALLQKYADSGITSVESMEILKVDPLSGIGTPLEIVSLFGGKNAYLEAIRDLEAALYQKVA